MSNPGNHDRKPGAGQPQEGSTTVPSRPKTYDELALQGRIAAENIEVLFAPVHDLVRGRANTFFLTPAFCVGGTPVISGYPAFHKLANEDFPLVDRALFAQALKFSRRLAQAGLHANVGAPVSFETLVSTSGRNFYRESLHAAGIENHPSLVLRISNLPFGVTASRIADCVTFLQPFALQIFVHLPAAQSSLSNCGLLGATGFSLTVAHEHRLPLERSTAWLAGFCENQLALSCVDGLNSEKELEVTRSASIRFGMGSALGPIVFRGDSTPLEIEAFTRNAQRAARSEGRNVVRLSTHREARQARRLD